jgi:orotidine-5'-phosphate decarboxylase
MEEVLRLAELVAGAGAHGLVCSGIEAGAVNKRFGSRLNILVPGVRPAGDAAHDQARVVTPSDAVRSGARYLVIGRAVTKAADPSAAMDRIRDEMAAATA